MIEVSDSPQLIIERMNGTINSDKVEIGKIIDSILHDSPSLIDDYKNGKTRVVGFIVGQVMKKTSGKANPALTNKMVVEELKRR